MDSTLIALIADGVYVGGGVIFLILVIVLLIWFFRRV